VTSLEDQLRSLTSLDSEMDMLLMSVSKKSASFKLREAKDVIGEVRAGVINRGRCVQIQRCLRLFDVLIYDFYFSPMFDLLCDKEPEEVVSQRSWKVHACLVGSIC
jgi:hypothetical protein